MARLSTSVLQSAFATAAVAALAATLTAFPAAAQTGQGRPTDLSAYSLRFWPLNTLRRGQTVRASTPYGILTCTSIGTGHRRQCSLR